MVLVAGCAKGGGSGVPGSGDARGGTPVNASSSAFKAAMPGLSPDELRRHLDGDALFEAKFVNAPSPVNPGLGPFYNNNACAACHRNDGRGMPVLAPGTGHSQLVAKVSLDAGTGEEPGGSVPVPGIGLQIQDQAVFGARAPARVELTWTEEPETFADGTVVSLRRPHPRAVRADGSELTDVGLSLRQPPALIGLGLLEAVSDTALRDLEAASQGDGRIAGRLNEVWSRTLQATVPGRFGRKANKALVADQVGLALALDMGLDNALFPGENGGVEGDPAMVATLTFYARTLAPPERRYPEDPAVQRGEATFARLGCSGCHMPELKTGDGDTKALANKTIHPYTDLLLHDLGEGLADERRDFLATGREWRTVALWGLGLAQTVLPYSCYLHDGRARTLEEAILWHGGQASGPREGFRQLPAAERAALVSFLSSL